MIIRLRWVVAGSVQVVFFRKNIAETATTGAATPLRDPRWRGGVGCKGVTLVVNQMLEWLRSTGSPKSVIEKFHNLTIPVVDGESSFAIIK